MKPYVICHMMGSVDGRIKGAKWKIKNTAKYFEEPASKIKVDAWLVGRVTMQEFSSKTPRKKRAGRFDIPKTDYVAKLAKTYAVAIDPKGKCNWKTDMVSTEHVIEVLTEKVSGEYLDHLRHAGVSYIFGGKSELDLELVLTKLRKLFNIKRLRIDGGAHVNGSFLKARLIDEFSYVLMPVADGTIGAPTMFEAFTENAKFHATHFKLKSVKRIYRNSLWLRYITQR
jgi:2,5-diamino-6-(ribosylamino)-4(3H)-pyrimidinone 5'-phosphate reductase